MTLLTLLYEVTKVMTSCFFCSLYSATSMCCWFIRKLVDNIFMNSVEFVTVSGNLLCQLADHLLQFLILKDFRVCYWLKHEQIFKGNYAFFNSNEFKNEINQIDSKTVFYSHDMNLCFWEIFAYPYLRFWWPCTNQKVTEKGEISYWKTMDW